MLRRDFVGGLLALPSFATLARAEAEPGLQTGAGTDFSPYDVVTLARQKAQRPYAPRPSVPPAWTDISYDDYRSIWFDSRNALWRDEPATPLRVDVFAPGLYFPQPIAISVIEQGQAHPLVFDMAVFDKTDKFPDLPLDDSLGYSGLRLRAELETPGLFTEFAVFQGASYFRAIGTGDIYGLSARGLAINTAEPQGEEFPDFIAFWIEKPDPGQRHGVVHALLDGPSCTGAYRFEITPGQPLDMEVSATLFPRQDMTHVGLAPLTSMFMFDETNRDRFSDFRQAVHDSDGLLMRNGAGETLWRPLANPKTLQVSAFVDENPRGFGLMQRARRFSDFADLHAHYHRRPGVWIEPKGDWGKGAVMLVEIPTDLEIYDNIVSYWRPDDVWTAGSEHKLDYRLTWGDHSDYGQGLMVLNTRLGGAFRGQGYVCAIDFAPGPDLPEDLTEATVHLWASAGEIKGQVLERNPETKGPRLAFTFDPGEAGVVEFRAGLALNGMPSTETWMYRWTA